MRSRYREGIMIKATLGNLLFVFGLLSLPLWAQGSRSAYENPVLPLKQRVKDLVSRMTLQEKVSQLGHTADPVPRLGVPQCVW